MKIGALLIFTLLTVAGQSQNTINSYKYVLVPQKFGFLNSDDEYGLNSTTKSLLEQKGFTVFWSNGNLPQALAANRCTALLVEVTQRKALFTTNLTLLLKDCSGNIIFKGKEGRSWEKEFPVAYGEALKNAFTSLNALPYKYDSTLSAQAQQPAAASTAAATSAASTLAATPAASATSTTSPTSPASVAAPASATPPTTSASPASLSSSQVPVSPQVAAADISGTLYAQVTPNGYQLIDTVPRRVLTLLKTSVQDCYLAGAGPGALNGIVFKKNGEWFFEYYKEGALVSQKLAIKF
jgi:hypothetical protein